MGVAPSRKGFRALGSCAFGIALMASVFACDDPPIPSGGGYVGGSSKANTKDSKQSAPSIRKRAPDAPEKKSTQPAAPRDVPQRSSLDYTELTKVWGLGELHDLGPAGPATATSGGVYFVTRSDKLVLAKRKGKDQFVPLNIDRSHFARYGRGPSISKTHAYWVSEKSLLLRTPLRGGDAEVLFDQARIGTRTSVVTAAGRDVVTFIAEIKELPYAYVWASKGTEKIEILRLTPEGANATSAALVQGEPHPRAIILSGRLGMSPVHVRRIRTTPKRLTLEPDEVVWVGPGSHVLTEIHGLSRKGDDTVAFLPTAKNFNDFGIAQLMIGPDPGQIQDPHWQIFPNGLDPAPVATGNICGKSYVLFARPTEARPRAPQELHLVEIKNGPLGEGEVVARSRAFNDLSLAHTKGGAVVAWTADRRTWGMVLTCPAAR